MAVVTMIVYGPVSTILLSISFYLSANSHRPRRYTGMVSTARCTDICGAHSSADYSVSHSRRGTEPMEESHYHTSAQGQQTDAAERLQADLNNASSLTVI